MLKANNMFRFPLIVCVSLICGITAKPYKPWNKLTDEAFQDTVMSFDGKGKLPLGVQVEPPENMDETDYEIDHSMMIWKSMKGSGQDKQPLKAEEDLDELDHPSVVDRLKVQIQNLEAKMNQYPEVDEGHIDQTGFSKVASHEPEQDWDDVYHKAREELAGYLAPLMGDAEVRVAHTEPEVDEDEMYHRDVPASPVESELLSHELQGENGVRVHLEPEEDMDDLYHKDVEASPVESELLSHELEGENGVRVHLEPEEDMDDLYHKDVEASPVESELLSHELEGENGVRVHLEPEEDMDDLYHKDVQELTPYRDDTEAAAPAYMPSQRRHTAPEADLDDLWH